MSRIVLGMAAGLVLSQVVALCFWGWGFYLHPPSPLDDMNPQLAQANPSRLPFAPLVWQALGQGVGAFVGGWWAARLGREGPWLAWGVGGAGFVLAIILAVLHPRPFWFFPMSAVFIAAGAYGAGRLAGGTAPKARAKPGPKRAAA